MSFLFFILFVFLVLPTLIFTCSCIRDNALFKVGGCEVLHFKKKKLMFSFSCDMQVKKKIKQEVSSYPIQSDIHP
jgi:hypothetical protein